MTLTLDDIMNVMYESKYVEEYIERPTLKWYVEFFMKNFNVESTLSNDKNEYLFGNEKPNAYDILDNFHCFVLIMCGKNSKKMIEESKHFINLVSKYNFKNIIIIIATERGRQIFINDTLKTETEFIEFLKSLESLVMF
jgi:hypothetical protein